MANFINGAPDVMAGYAPQGPDPAALGSRQELVSQLGEAGAALVAADAAATEKLTTFVTWANAGFETLTRIAGASGLDYLIADEIAKATIIGTGFSDTPAE